MNKKVEMPYEAWQQQKCDPENKSNYRYVLSAKVIETSTPENSGRCGDKPEYGR